METFTERFDLVRAWWGAVIAITVALVGGSLAFPRLVWDGFLWHYFWGPVVADGNGAFCAVRSGGETTLLDSASACQAASGYVAYPGYTAVSEVGYAVTLLLMLVGLIFLLRTLGIGKDRELFFALFPFMLFGGALRVVEDAGIAAMRNGVEPAIPFPWSALIISPFIYFTVFFITLAAIVVSVGLERRDSVSTYRNPLFVIGGLLLVGTVGYLTVLAFTRTYVDFFPQMTILTIALASVIAYGTWKLIGMYAPDINKGTRTIGLVVIWGHAVDGVANVLAADWAVEIGLPFYYSAKHPVNRFIINFTDGILPESIAAITGTSWPFLVVKIIAAVAVVWVFDESIFEESPRYAILLLIAILAVGLGPGTRDMLRATFGI
ncbi:MULTISPECIES: DUF63 family protein [unclassified Haladaptatus]|uniref:DUF63 family protein n=1 Tax=unclassified Haladaptatus TaxID=2622732 RepID=UPI0023E8DBA8|nr:MULTISPECIES: DUF63 family protein [unclassified Haladaptatus]